MSVFGAYFRRAEAGINVTAAVLLFRLLGIPVGITAFPIGASWEWHGFCSTIPFNEVFVVGNGSLPGYVGMDDVCAVERTPGSTCPAP
jgi:hypothetical protein